MNKKSYQTKETSHLNVLMQINFHHHHLISTRISNKYDKTGKLEIKDNGNYNFKKHKENP